MNVCTCSSAMDRCPIQGVFPSHTQFYQLWSFYFLQCIILLYWVQTRSAAREQLLIHTFPAWSRVQVGNDKLSVCNSSGSHCLSYPSCPGLIISQMQCAAVQGWCNLNANQVEETGTTMQATVGLVIPREMGGGLSFYTIPCSIWGLVLFMWAKDAIIETYYINLLCII